MGIKHSDWLKIKNNVVEKIIEHSQAKLKICLKGETF